MKVRHYLNSLALAAALVVPAGLAVSTAQAQVSVGVRIYDPIHKDYHHWDDREDRAYRSWFVERHENYRDYKRLKKDQQRTYWQWRHDHPDHDERR